MTQVCPPKTDAVTTGTAATLATGIRANGWSILDDWLETLNRAGIPQGSVSIYRTAAARLLHWLDERGIELTLLDSAVVEQYLSSLGISPITIATYRNRLRYFLDELAARQVIPANPYGSRRPMHPRRGAIALPAPARGGQNGEFYPNTAFAPDGAVIVCYPSAFLRISGRLTRDEADRLRKLIEIHVADDAFEAAAT
jgi:Phage integrase, N-terminal SAM-like domain